MVGHGGLVPVRPRLRQIAAKVAGVDEPVSDPAGEVRRQGKPGQRLVNAAEPVNPDLVVEAVHRFHRALALPFGGETVGFVEDIAQAEHQLRAPRRLALQHGQHLAVEARRLLVHDHHVGPEGLGRA